jgi:predicted KAP-like P-loop ATPase
VAYTAGTRRKNLPAGAGRVLYADKRVPGGVTTASQAMTHNQPPSQHPFSADRAIRSRDEDQLHRRTFAEELARAVGAWKGNDSLVIALYGPWGSGKSSIKNMVIDALRSIPDSATVIDFNPWQVANHAQLSEAFFDEIGIAIGQGAVATRKDRNKRVKNWKRYTARLKSSGEFLSLSAGLIRWMLGIAAFAILGSTISSLRPFGIVLGVVCLLAALLTKSAKITEQIVAFLEPGAEKEPLEETKANVQGELAKLSTPIVVMVDDLDRLTPLELLEMLQLVKVNGDFPNLIYLLLCDRPTAERNVQEATKAASGRDYLEKIVQVAFDVPLLDRKRLQQILFNGLDALITDKAVSKHFNQTRWGNIFVGGLQHYFTTLRQVNRFLSTLSFHITLFKSEGVFEVNVIDLIALETLRVYEPDLYLALRKNKELLTGTADFGGGNRDEKKREINVLLKGVPDSPADAVREIIKHLFPPVEWALGGSHYGADWAERWARELRVCSEDMFDRYFHFVLPPGDLSQATIEQLMAAAADRDALRLELQALASRGLLELALDRLEAYKQQIPLKHGVPFVTALFDMGDRLSSERAGMFGISPAMHVQRIIYWFLKQEKDPVQRGCVLRDAIDVTDGVNIPVAFISLIEPNPNEGGTKEEFVPARMLQDLKTLCVQKIESALNAGSTPTDLLAILYRWREWAGPDEPAQYCQVLIQSDEGLLRFLRALTVCARSSSLTDYVLTQHWYIRRRDLEAFVAFDAVESRVNGLCEGVALSQEDERALKAFNEAAERRRAGLPDEDPFGMRREDHSE